MQKAESKSYICEKEEDSLFESLTIARTFLSTYILPEWKNKTDEKRYFVTASSLDETTEADLEENNESDLANFFPETIEVQVYEGSTSALVSEVVFRCVK